jgi:hypothetical protein
MNIRIEFNNVDAIEASTIAEALKLLSDIAEGPKFKPDFKAAAKKAVEKVESGQKPPEDPKTEAKTVAKTKYTLDELRNLAISKASNGNSAGVKKTLDTFGLEKVTATPDHMIDDLYTALEAL